MRAFTPALLLFSVSLSGFAQKFGTAEYLAPAIPTPQAVVDRMLEVARIKPGETLYDLGSGDGRVVITAVQKYGARAAVGIEIDPVLCRTSVNRIKALGLQDRVRIIEDSALRVDLSPADVVTMFFLTSSNDRLKPILTKHLKSSARVVSTEFPIKSWKATEVVHMKSGTMVHTIYVYQMNKIE